MGASSSSPVVAPTSVQEMSTGANTKGHMPSDQQSSKDPASRDHVIPIDDVYNEATWREILHWEELHPDQCSNPTLKKIVGKSTKFSPRAILRRLMGFKLPFDRHDWIVDRCGKEVRYVIDYYGYTISIVDCVIDYPGGDNVNLKNHKYARLDVRPALDSFEAVWDVMRVSYQRYKDRRILRHIENHTFLPVKQNLD